MSAPEWPVVVEGPGPVVVEGDPDRLRQVVDNLVGNAVSHTPPGTGIRILVRTQRTQRTQPTPDATDGRQWAVVTVHDDGPGIDPADAPRVFEAFYRSDPSRSRSSGGAGLGLAIVAAIAEAHGGTVALLPGPGATFEVRLPVARPGTATAAASEPGPRSGSVAARARWADRGGEQRPPGGR